MIDWLKNLLNSGIRYLQELVNAALAGLVGIWSVFSNLLHVLRIVFGGMADQVIQFINQLDNLAHWIYNTLRWIITDLVPSTIRYLIGQAEKIATGLVNTARAYLVRLVDYVKRWAQDLFDWLGGHIQDVSDWLWSHISPVVDWLTRYGRKAVDLVLHPDQLAAWLLPALWGPLWRYLSAKAVPIGRWVLGRSVSAVLSGAGMVESVLVKLL